MNTNETFRRFTTVRIAAVALAALCLMTPPAAAQDSDGDTLSDSDESSLYQTDPLNADTDGDGLRDDWEILGIPYTAANGQPKRCRLMSNSLNPARGARRKTLYIEADSMSGMDPAGMAHAAATWFTNAPVSNPDGSIGVDIYVHNDELGLPRSTWSYNPPSVPWPPEFAAFKSNHFGSPSERGDPSWGIPGGRREAKLKAYRYVVFADRLGSTTVSGVAEQQGNDMIVTLGGWNFGQWPLTPAELLWKQRVTMGVFVHELGHNLGLGHGGIDPVNFKPNYHSVMNYSWTVPRYVGFSFNPTAAQSAYGASWSPTFSSTAFPTLNESALSEANTSLCGGCGAPHNTHVVPVGPPGPWGWGRLESESQAGIDFDRDGVYPESSVQADINYVLASQCPGYICDWINPCSEIDQCGHQGANDWAIVQFMGTGGNYANGVYGAAIPPGDEPSFEQVRMLSFVGGCEFDDAFDFYDDAAAAPGLHGQGGWKGWDNDPTFDAVVSPTVARSGDFAVEIAGAADLVHEFCGRQSTSSSLGMAITAWQYIPADFVSGGSGLYAGSFFVVMNRYADGAHNYPDWGVMMQFDSLDGMLKVFHGDGENTIAIPFVRDRWVRIKSIIDLDSDWTRVYYDDALVAEYPWTGGVFGLGGGALDIAAVDLYAQGSTPIYYDNLHVHEVCGVTLASDEDADGLDLSAELGLGTSSCLEDTDGDGLSDNEQMLFGTDPLVKDTDADGLLDGDELELGYQPLLPDSDGDGQLDGEEDLDFDGLSNADERSVHGTQPLNPDSDFDGLSDGVEVAIVHTDPLDPDTDDDGRLDSADNCPRVANPEQEDSDGNGVGDECDAPAACPGDLNGDGQVALDDLTTLLSNFGIAGGATPEQGDSDDDGDIDIADLSFLLSHFGTGCP